MGASERTGDDLRELTRVVVRVPTLNGNEDVDAVRAARLRKRDKPQRVEGLLEQQRDLDRLGKAGVSCGIEVEEHEIGAGRLVDARIPRVHVDAAHVDHPQQRRLVIDEREVHPLLLTRLRACWDVRAGSRNPGRYV